MRRDATRLRWLAAVGIATVLAFTLLRLDSGESPGSEEPARSDGPAAGADEDDAELVPSAPAPDAAAAPNAVLAPGAAAAPDAAVDEEGVANRPEPPERSEEGSVSGDSGEPDVEAPPPPEPVPGAPDKRDIAQGIQDQMPEILECYQGWLRQNPNIEGEMSVEFVIAASEEDPELGRVERIELADTTLGHLWMEGCVLSAMEDAEFEPPEAGGIVIVRYPLVFSPADD